MIAKEKGDDKALNASEEVIFKIEIPANRYDLLCLTGLARALLIFLNKINIPIFKVIEPEQQLEMIVKKSVNQIYCFIIVN